ncbi:uncharacterized protein DS421_13g438350 [Arachis hypogaea]|nr:uncharacterized protein DS421_13g438350 [Arachis hypogaea]
MKLIYFHRATQRGIGYITWLRSLLYHTMVDDPWTRHASLWQWRTQGTSTENTAIGTTGAPRRTRTRTL